MLNAKMDDADADGESNYEPDDNESADSADDDESSSIDEDGDDVDKPTALQRRAKYANLKARAAALSPRCRGKPLSP